MSVPAAYLGVILIWSTTPLAIRWSGEGVGFLFGAAARMGIGLALCLAIALLWRLPVPWHRRARQTYVAAGLGIFGTLFLCYWAAQFVPSGWVSVLFGLSPMMTGVMALIWLGENPFTPTKVSGMVAGVVGLAVIFAGAGGAEHAALGIVAILAGVAIQCASAVWVKRLGAGVPPFAQTVGGLLVAAPLFGIAWAAFGTPPAVVPERVAGAIAYLAVMGSVVGFSLYYYMLSRMDTGRVALITLITPVLALLIGNTLNGEEITARVALGSTLILFGLALYLRRARVQ